MKTRVLFATSNPNKVREVKEICGESFEILSLSDVGVSVRKEEDGSTFEENALIKARDVAEQVQIPVFSDDSGLAIDALGGFPGIHSARFMEGHPYPEKCEVILEKMKGIENRTARFLTAMAYVDPIHHIEKVFFGTNEGHIIDAYPEGEQNGFGYDPIFYSDDLQMTFGEASEEKKDEVSHRARAMRALLAYWKGETNLEQKEARKWELIDNVFQVFMVAIIFPALLVITYAVEQDISDLSTGMIVFLMVAFFATLASLILIFVFSVKHGKAKKKLVHEDRLYSFRGSFCPMCGTKIALDNEFCPTCGTPITQNAKPLFIDKNDSDKDVKMIEFLSMLFFGSWSNYITTVLMFIFGIVGSILIQTFRWLWICIAILGGLYLLYLLVLPIVQTKQHNKTRKLYQNPAYIYEDSIAQVTHQATAEGMQAQEVILGFGFDQVLFCTENKRGYYFSYTVDGKKTMVQYFQKDSGLDEREAEFLHKKILELN